MGSWDSVGVQQALICSLWTRIGLTTVHNVRGPLLPLLSTVEIPVQLDWRTISAKMIMFALVRYKETHIMSYIDVIGLS